MSSRDSQRTSVFYSPMDGVEEIRTGYLFKSPPSNRFKVLKSWKRRFFVLLKTSDNAYLLKYFRSEENKEKLQGGIDLCKVLHMNPSPQTHSKWPWINKTFKCSSEAVLFINTSDREYFLIAENKEDVDSWFRDLYRALMTFSPLQVIPEQLPNVFIKGVILSQDNTTNEQFQLGVINGHKRPTSAPERTSDGSFYDTPSSILKQITQDCVEIDSVTQGFEKIRSISEPVDIATKVSLPERKPWACDWSCEQRKTDTESYKLLPYCQQLGVINGHKRPTSAPERTSDGSFYDTPSSILKQITQENAEDDAEDDDDETEENANSLYMKMERILEIANETAMEDFPPTSSVDYKSMPVEKDIFVSQKALRDHLVMEEVEGRPCVCNWTGDTCLFHLRDRILAVNDIETASVEDVQMYLGKLVKNQVKVTIQRFMESKAINWHYPGL